MAKRRREEDDLELPPLANAVFAGDEAARTLAQQGIQGPTNALALARTLRAQGASAREIHARTSDILKGTPYSGVHFAADGKPLFEIDDSSAKLRKSALAKGSAYMGDVLDHPELYKAVPGSSMATVAVSPDSNNSSYYARAQHIDIGKKHAKKLGKSDILLDSAKGPLLHEGQHVVAELHGLPQGAHPDDYRSLYPGDSAEAKAKRLDAYWKTSGEQLAEATRKRADLTAEDRRQLPPAEDPWMDPVKSHRRPPAEPRKQAFIGDLTEIAVDAWKRATTREIVEGRPIHQRRIDPRKVAADPETFQFKSGGDASGVTDRLKGVTQWDPLAAGKQVVYQRANGEYVIADGHQRRGLALRAIEGGQKNVALDAFVLREKDRWSPRDVRAYAALKNMKESSGNALDMAKVMRERPDLVGKSLPMSDAKIREAVSLSKLSAKAFDMVVGGAIKPEHAAAVGVSVGDSASHADMLTEMAKAGMRSAEHARLYVQQAMAAASTSETTGSLFGDETKVRSLLAERAKVLDRALGALKSDKRIFAMLEREAANIEAAGNRLAHASNLEKADTAGRLAELVERLSTTRGPVSEMLDKAALAMAEGKSPSQAARGFVNDVGRTMKDGGINALTGNVVAPPAPVDPVDPNQMGMFGGDEPSGKPQGWSDEAREASAKVRKGKAKGKQPNRRGRKQMMIEDGRPAPSKNIDASVAKGQNLKRASGAEAFADGWTAAKSGRRLPAGVDPDFAAGYRQYQTDKSPRAAERAMVEYLAGQKVPGTQEVTLAGKTKPGEQGSFLPEATTKEKIAAAAKAKGRPSAAQQPMDDGMFGSGMNQTDLVEMAKAKHSLPAPKAIMDSDGNKWVKGQGDAWSVDQSHKAALTQTENSGKPAGWSDEARKASAEVRASDQKPSPRLLKAAKALFGAVGNNLSRDDIIASIENVEPAPGKRADKALSAALKAVAAERRVGQAKAPKMVTADDFDFSKAPQFRKTATLRADQITVAKGGEKITTRQPDGKGGSFVETTNVAKPGDRIVTRSPGDSYVIGGEKFSKMYEPDPANPGTFRSANSGRAVRVKQDVQIKAPWGEIQTVKKGGVIFKSDVDGGVYGNQKETFDADFVKVPKAAAAAKLQDMSLKELRAKAKADGIRITGAKTKKAIAARIQRGKPNIFGSDNKYQSPKPGTAPFDPHAVGLVPTAQREGPAGLARVIGGMTAEQARATAKAQGIHVPASIKTDAGVREFVARATFKQMADRRAAAGGDPSKMSAMAEEAGNALRGTQNAANREAIAKNRKAKAKGLDVSRIAADLRGHIERGNYDEGYRAIRQLAADKSVTNADLKSLAREMGERTKASSTRGSLISDIERPFIIGSREVKKRADKGLPPLERASAAKPATAGGAIFGDEKIARAAGLDAGNRSMKAAGRTAWNATDQAAATKAMLTVRPEQGGAQHQAALTQTQNQPPAAEPAKPAPKSKGKARAGKVAGLAVGPVALGAGIAAAAVIAANTSAEAGQSTAKQAASATVAAAQAAAPVAVIGGGLAAGVKLGLMTAGRAALVSTGIGAVAIGISAAAYGAQAAKEGKGKLGIAKAAAWGAINGVVPIDAVRDATRSTAARVSGTPARPSEKQMGEYVQANNAFQRQQAMNTTQTDQSDRKPGWSPEARIAAAKSRGVALPYGGNPAAAPGYIPPKTHNGKAA